MDEKPSCPMKMDSKINVFTFILRHNLKNILQDISTREISPTRYPDSTSVLGHNEVSPENLEQNIDFKLDFPQNYHSVEREIKYQWKSFDFILVGFKNNINKNEPILKQLEKSNKIVSVLIQN